MLWPWDLAMGDELDRYVLYLNRAVALRMAADGDKSPLSRSALLALAIDYEQLADVLEHLIRSNNQDTYDFLGATMPDALLSPQEMNSLRELAKGSFAREVPTDHVQKFLKLGLVTLDLIEYPLTDAGERVLGWRRAFQK